MSDSPLPQPLLRALLKIHSEFAFIGVGRTNTDNELEGDIFVFPVTFGGNASWRLVKRKFHGAVSQGLFLERLLAAEADSSGAFWDEYVEGLRKPLACEALFMCRFKVSRSGIATLSPCDPEFRIGEYLALKMKWLESDELALDEATKKPIVRLRFHYLLTQVFGFLKDNLHIHQHHDDNLESLSALHFTRYADEGCGNEEPCPLVKTAHQLHRLILHYKRATQPTQHARIKGVVAYLRSLLLMIKAEDSCVPVEQRNLDYGLDNVLASVESKLEERRWVEEYKTRWINLVMIPTIGITAITTALVAVFQGQASDELLVAIGEFSREHYARMLFVVVGGVVGLNILLYGADTVFHPLGRMWLYLCRLTQPLRRRVIGLVWILAGAGLIVLIWQYAISKFLAALAGL